MIICYSLVYLKPAILDQERVTKGSKMHLLTLFYFSCRIPRPDHHVCSPRGLPLDPHQGEGAVDVEAEKLLRPKRQGRGQQQRDKQHRQQRAQRRRGQREGAKTHTNNKTAGWRWKWKLMEIR
jgi:hypothetical protein